MKRFWSVVLQIAVALFVLVIVLYSIKPSFRRTPPRHLDPEKACYINQRILMGAIEMYNMDNAEPITFYDDAIQKLLLEGGYLKYEIRNPEPDCRLGSIGDLARDGRITCKFHGDPKHPIEHKKPKHFFDMFISQIFGGS